MSILYPLSLFFSLICIKENTFSNTYESPHLLTDSLCNTILNLTYSFTIAEANVK